MRSTMKKRALTAITAGVLLALGGGIAYATIPDNNGVIHACYKQNSGQLRVSDDGGCSSSESPLDWNQSGSQGPTGNAGPAGPPGSEGPPGPANVVVRTLNAGVGFVTVTFHLDCYPGERATGAGYGGPDEDLPFLKVLAIVPQAGSQDATQGDTPTGFTFTVDNSSAGTTGFHPITFQPYILCAG
jgi:hypothetical protein